MLNPLDLFVVDPTSINTSEFKVGSTREHLDILASIRVSSTKKTEFLRIEIGSN
jgi:hypothetical protein